MRHLIPEMQIKNDTMILSGNPTNTMATLHAPKIVEGWFFKESFASRPDNCACIIRILLNQLNAFKWSKRDVFGIHMAMEEAIMNAIRHGNQCIPQKKFQVLIQLNAHRFYARITDEGPGFDPRQVPDPTLDENIEKTCGRGVMLIRQFVDSAKYNAKGNSIELKKNSTRPTPSKNASVDR